MYASTLSRENDICHGIGCLCGRSNDVRIKNSTRHFSTNYHRDLRWIYYGVHASLPRQLRHIWPTTRTPVLVTPLPWPMSPCSVELKPSKMCVFLTSGNLLGHNVSQEGIAMDPTRYKPSWTLLRPLPWRPSAVFWAKLDGIVGCYVTSLISWPLRTRQYIGFHYKGPQ